MVSIEISWYEMICTMDLLHNYGKSLYCYKNNG